MGITQRLPLVYLLIFGLFMTFHYLKDLRPLRFENINLSETTIRPRTNFPIQIILPKSEHGIIDVGELNEDLFQMHKQSRQPLAQVVLREEPDTSGDFRLTIVGHRWRAWGPPPRIQSSPYAEWVYLVSADFAPAIRERLAHHGQSWTRTFMTTSPRINPAIPELIPQNVLRKSTTTQLRRWILNYLSPETNPDDFR